MSEGKYHWTLLAKAQALQRQGLTLTEIALSMKLDRKDIIALLYEPEKYERE